MNAALSALALAATAPQSKLVPVARNGHPTYVPDEHANTIPDLPRVRL